MRSQEKLLIVTILAAVLLWAFVGRGIKLQELTGEPGYHHTWTFSGYTTKEFVESGRTIDETYFPVYSHIGEIKETATIAIITGVTKELVGNLTERGYKVTVKSVYPTVTIQTRTERTQYRDYTIVKFYHTFRADVTVTFDTDKPLTESPIPAWVLILLLAIADKIPMIVLAAFVGAGIYTLLTTWIPSWTTTKSSVVIRYYDENGRLIKEEEKTTVEPSWMENLFGWLAALVFPLLLLVFGVLIIVLAWKYGLPGKKRQP